MNKDIVEEQSLILDTDIKVRANKVIIDGYVNAVGRDSRIITENGNKFVEQIKPGAFARAIGRGTNIVMLIDHDENRVVAETSGTLRLIEDSIGLHAHAEIVDDELAEKARNNLLRGWSFGFFVLSFYEETRADGITRRIVDDLELVEVSIIDDKEIPCYEGTSVEVRKKENAQILNIRAIVDEEEEKEEIPETYYDSFKQRIHNLTRGEKENEES